MATLPTCIKATRIGHWSMGSENEYDAFGEQAPITWTCTCGHRLTLEILDYDTGEYTNTPQHVKDGFLADHATCTVPLCYVCGMTPVGRQGGWCYECIELDELTSPATDEYIPF